MADGGGWRPETQTTQKRRKRSADSGESQHVAKARAVRCIFHDELRAIRKLFDLLVFFRSQCGKALPTRQVIEAHRSARQLGVREILPVPGARAFANACVGKGSGGSDTWLCVGPAMGCFRGAREVYWTGVDSGATPGGVMHEDRQVSVRTRSSRQAGGGLTGCSERTYRWRSREGRGSGSRGAPGLAAANSVTGLDTDKRPARFDRPARAVGSVEANKTFRMALRDAQAERSGPARKKVFFFPSKALITGGGHP